MGDLSIAAEADAIINEILKRGGVDIVVNNAGGGISGDWNWDKEKQVDETNTSLAWLQEWEGVYNRNVISMVRIINGLLPQMKNRAWGRFIQIGSICGSFPMAEYAAYSASKAAVINLTASLTKSLTGTKITANTVSPGTILTPNLESAALEVAKARAWKGSTWNEIEAQFVAEFMPNPSNRVGRPEEIAGLVAYLASPRAAYINGANFRVDGGFVPTVN